MLGGALVASCAGYSPAAFPSPPKPRRTPSAGLPWPEANQIVAETVVPKFPAATFVVSDRRYGAIADGTTDNSAAFRKAIEACSSSGGGHVAVPAGIYSVGAIHLLSNVDLHLESGAVLQFNADVNNYPLVLTRHAGIECINHSPMVYGFGQTNIAVTGDGVLDASNTKVWNVGSDYTQLLEPLAAAGVPPEQRIIPQRGQLRSSFVEPYRCTNVLIQGVRLRQAQFWQLHPTLCRNVTIDGVSTGDTTNLNTDGCNPESCDHVVIKNSTFDSADDSIAIKSGRDADGRRVNAPCENIVIFGCRLQGRTGGIALGSEMTGGIRHLYVYDVRTYGRSTRYMLYVKSNSRRGGYATNLHLDKVQADHLGDAWVLAQMDYTGQSGTYPPTFADWQLSHLTGDSAPVVLRMTGLPGNPIRSVEITDSTFTNIAGRNVYRDVEAVRFQNVLINGASVSQ